MKNFVVFLDGVSDGVVPALAAFFFVGKERRRLVVTAHDMTQALEGQALKISPAPEGGYLLELIDYGAAMKQAEDDGAEVYEFLAGNPRK